MSTPTIADLLKYADLQMAAEAFLVESNGDLKSNQNEALRVGNGHASKLTATKAADFLEHWRVVTQQPNTKTGFSGTLFECFADDPATGAKAGERVISFRSTEFIDDSVRDNMSTDSQELSATGFTWGQLRDMEAWYQGLVASGKVSPGNFSVTGYSLGGHLASAFNEMHPGAAAQVSAGHWVSSKKT